MAPRDPAPGRTDGGRPSLLLTAGPTHEPIDAVRFLGNRSSGKMGVAIAHAAEQAGWTVTLLLGPTMIRPGESTGVRVIPFESTAELEARLHEHLHRHDALVMAAAVSDYRPIVSEDDLANKHRRGTKPLELRLEPTPDLLRSCADRRSPGQLLVGFALEPSDRLETSARAKLERKGIDLIVANPLETMGSDTVDGRVFASDEMVAAGFPAESRGEPRLGKPAFAAWLLNRVGAALDTRRAMTSAGAR